VRTVYRELEKLHRAHGRGLRAVVWAERLEQPGPKSALRVPGGGELGGPGFVEVSTLDEAERELRAFFKDHQDQLRVLPRDGVDKRRPRQRLRELMVEALNVTDAYEWSDQRILHFHPIAETDDIFTDDIFKRMTWTWNLPDMTTAIDKVLRPVPRDLVKKDGRPAYLAYTLLGALLDISPEKIAEKLRNFRRSSGRHPRA